jgi:alpha-glucosidase
MDTQVAFINKLDVSAFRAKLTDAETHLGSGTPLLLFDNHDNRGWICAMAMACTIQRFSACSATILFASRGASLLYYGDEIGMKTTPPGARRT